MADNTPTPPGGATPPRPAESAKVQPKKETVRINLPPKPTSAPTIKLPTLAPGGPPPSIGTPMPTVVAAPAPSKAPAPPAPPPASAAPARMAAAAAPAKPAAPAAAPRPMPAPAYSGVTGLDKGLAIGAAVAGLAALGTVVYLAFILKDTV